MSDLLGTLVGEYRVERRLGEGAMGEVFEAVHPIIGKRVAVKVLRREIAHDEQQALRFIEEARAVTAIRHPAIVEVFGFGTLEDGRLYLVMDLLEGESFSAYLKDQAPLPPETARGWLLELLDAVAAAHEAGVVHRDLKPSNLFLVGRRGSQRLKVLDFGIARRVARREQLTRPNMLLGSPAFMAPEQIRGEAVPASDLYAIGCIAFAMLTGQNVFRAESVVGVLNHHLLTPAPSPATVVPSVPAPLGDLVQRLLAKEPGDRPATAREAKALLAALDLGSGPVVLDEPEPEPEPAKTLVHRVGETEPSLEPVQGTETFPGRQARATDTAPALAVGAVTQTGEREPDPRTTVHPLPAARRTAVIVGAVSVVALLLGLGVLLNENGAREDQGQRAVAPPPQPEAAPPAPPPPLVAPAPSGGGAAEPAREASADQPKPPERKPANVVEPVAVRRPPDPVAPRAGTPVTSPRAPNTPPRVAGTPDRGDGPGAGLAKTPRRADLEAKLVRLESAVRAGRFSGGPAAALLLEDARDQLAKESPADRVELQNILDTWERKYLRP